MTTADAVDRDALRDTDKATGNRWYIYPPTGERLVSVTTVLGNTEGKQRYLVPWSARLAAECAIDNMELLQRIKAADGRPAAVKHAADQSERIRHIKADAGTYVHDVVEQLILWAASPEGSGAEIILPVLPEHLAGADYDDEPLPDVVDWMIDGFLNFVADFRPEFLAAEMPVYNQPLGIAGTLDIAAAYHDVAIGPAGRFIAAPGNRVALVTDVKTGKNLEITWPEQVAAYKRCPECLLPMGEMAKVPVTEAAAVLHLRPEHRRGYRLMLISGERDEEAWQTFLNALSVYKDRQKAKAKPGKVVYPPREDGTIQQPDLADLDGEGYGRILSPLIKAGIGDLEQLAAMSAGELIALKGVGGKTVQGVQGMLADHGLHLRDEGLRQVYGALIGEGVSA